MPTSLPLSTQLFTLPGEHGDEMMTDDEFDGHDGMIMVIFMVMLMVMMLMMMARIMMTMVMLMVMMLILMLRVMLLMVMLILMVGTMQVVDQGQDLLSPYP